MNAWAIKGIIHGQFLRLAAGQAPSQPQPGGEAAAESQPEPVARRAAVDPFLPQSFMLQFPAGPTFLDVFMDGSSVYYWREGA